MRKVLWRERFVVVALLTACAAACGQMLGLSDPTVVQDAGSGDATVTMGEGGAGGDGAPDQVAALDGGEDSDVLMGSGPEALAPCPGTQQRCDGTCTDTTSDTNNCGACGNVCSNGTSCVGSACVLLCEAGTACSPQGDAGSPYCTDLTSDPQNCGTCGTACAAMNAPAVCGDGGCSFGSCSPGFANCSDAGPPDGGPPGCYTNISADSLNCGACGHACPGGQYCGNGVCALNCPDGGAPCTSTTAGLYCASLATDPLNCNGCGNACPVANNVPGCSAGTCVTGTCNAGYSDCNGRASDGCEVNTGGSDPGNCGGCGTSCSTVCGASNVSATACSSGSCVVSACAAGYYDINQMCGDGCECQASALGTCASPIVLSNAASYTGVLVPQGADTWFQVTFTGNTATSTFHPYITLSVNPNSEYAFDVESDCTGSTITCAGSTTWETSYSGSTASTTGQTFAPIVVGNSGTVLVHVYRAMGAAVDCSPYTLSISN